MENVLKEKRDAYKNKLRKNSIIDWVDELKKVNEFKEILEECSILSTLETRGGLVQINPSGRIIGHEFFPTVESGFNFYEITVIMRYKIIKMEDRYGNVKLTDGEIEGLKNIAFKYNRILGEELDMEDRKHLLHIENTAIVLHYTIIPGVKVKSKGNGWCSITYGDGVTKEYCTILEDNQVELLEKVSHSITKGN